jgi:hypothetical protein
VVGHFVQIAVLRILEIFKLHCAGISSCHYQMAVSFALFLSGTCCHSNVAVRSEKPWDDFKELKCCIFFRCYFRTLHHMLLTSLPPQMVFMLVPFKSGIKKNTKMGYLSGMLFIPSYLIQNSLGGDKHKDIVLSRHFLYTVKNTA